MINANSYTDKEFCQLNVALTPLELELERRLLQAAQERDELYEWHHEEHDFKDKVSDLLGFGPSYLEDAVVEEVRDLVAREAELEARVDELEAKLEEYENISI